MHLINRFNFYFVRTCDKSFNVSNFIRSATKFNQETMNKFLVYFILGPPGAGKGTVCEQLVKELNLQHLSAGELLREECKNPNGKFSEEINRHMQAGTIVPVAITCGLLYQAMKEANMRHNIEKFLVDGFPRNEDNKKGWHENMDDKTIIKQVFVVDCDEENCISRCLGRKSGRADDNEETLKKRLKQFEIEGRPVIQHYEGLKLVTHINGNKSKDEVLASILESLEKIELREDH